MATPAGWYPSPDGTPVERFWDGSQWTSRQRNPGALPAGPYPPLTGGPPSAGMAPFQAKTSASSLGADPRRIEPRSTRWIVGVAMLVISIALSLSSFMDWAHLSYAATDGYGGYTKVSAELSGFGAVSVSIPNVKDKARRVSAEEQEASALKAEGPKVPGIAILTTGAVMAVTAWAYLNTRRRFGAAVTIAAISLLILINGLWRLANVRGMFNDPAAWSEANYSPGFGLIAATVAALVLLGLAATALVLERNASPVRGQTGTAGNFD